MGHQPIYQVLQRVLLPITVENKIVGYSGIIEVEGKIMKIRAVKVEDSYRFEYGVTVQDSNKVTWQFEKSLSKIK